VRSLLHIVDWSGLLMSGLLMAMLPLRLATPFLWCIAPGGSAQRGRRAFVCAVARGVVGVAGGMDAGGIHDMYKVGAQDKGTERDAS